MSASGTHSSSLRTELTSVFITAENIDVALQQTITILTREKIWAFGHAYQFVATKNSLVSTGILHGIDDNIADQDFINNISMTLPGDMIQNCSEDCIAEDVSISNDCDMQKDPRYAFLSKIGVKSVCRIPLESSKRRQYLLEFFSMSSVRPNDSILEILAETKQHLEKVIERIENAHNLQKLSRAVAASPVSVLICDTNGIIEYANPKFCTTTGYNLSEVIGSNTNLVNSGIHSSVLFKNLWSEILQGRNWQGEICNKKKDGNLFWEKVVISPIRNLQNQITHFVAIKDDISEKKKVEAEMKAAKEAAIASDRAKTQFVANMSHEFRTPLNAIIGLSHLLQHSSLPATLQRKVKQIASSAEGLQEIVNTILNYSRIELGEIELHTTTFDLSSILDDIGAIIGQRARNKNLEFIIDIYPDLPDRLEGDPVRLRQVLLNLAGNAVKFTEDGEVILRVELVQKNEDLVQILFTVKDSGIGISEEKLASLFLPFTQRDASTAQRSIYSGLGLHISKRVVELMGGELRVVSNVGVGSTFQFGVQLRYVQNPPLQINVDELSSLKLAIVEDNPEVRNAMRNLMGIYVKTVRTYESGSALLNNFQNANTQDALPDVLLLDSHLSDFTAEEIVRRLNDMGITNVPVVIISGKNEEDVLESCSPAAITDIYTKPITHSIALDILLRAWNRKSGQHTKSVPSIYPKFRNYLHRILLVEDNPTNREMAAEILEMEGYRVDTAVNGKEAVEMIFGNPPTHYSAVLMDLLMPVLDGMDAVKKIRALEEFDTLPIIALSADVQESVRAEALESGFNDFINKPITPDTFFRILDNWVFVENTDKLKSDPNGEIGDILNFNGLTTVDIFTGLKYIGNDTARYQKMLSRFSKEHGADAEIIARQLEHGDMDSANRTLHTLKGVARTLGCLQLQQLSEELEATLRQSTIENSITALNQLQIELHSVVSELANFEPASSAADISVEPSSGA